LARLGTADPVNLGIFADTKAWADVVRGPITPAIEEPAFLTEAIGEIPSQPWTEATWKVWTGALSAWSDRKGGALFHPLKLALTAQDKGPEMAKLLPSIGGARAKARLEGKRA